jgi:hypothetical protein
VARAVSNCRSALIQQNYTHMLTSIGSSPDVYLNSLLEHDAIRDDFGKLYFRTQLKVAKHQNHESKYPR